MRIKFLYVFTGCCLLCGSLHAQERLYPNEFPLNDVVLLDGPFKTCPRPKHSSVIEI